jgi:hypothetical protein
MPNQTATRPEMGLSAHNWAFKTVPVIEQTWR